uniref:FHA domain-containing protein n=1 Tax=Heterorhabditis bacteriophora TaxID=37862 RepID=A0A1I7X8V4_HETBA
MDKRRNDSFMVIGRLPNCDVVLDHPSISRYHCVLQYGEDLIDRSGKGWHLFDMGSTHGSRANKKKLPAKQYVRARVGFVLQFGGSSRLISIVGPDSDLSKRLTSSEKETYALEEINREKGQESDGISWGLDYEETDDEPITTISFYSLRLPIEISGVDRMYTAQATVSTSKKDAQFQCALEACRVLDSYGILRRANMKIRDTYESLCVKRDETREMIVEVQTQLDKLQRKNSVADGGSDSLDEYCRQLSQEICIAEDMKIKIQKSMLRQKLVGLTHDAQHLEKLIKIAKPEPSSVYAEVPTKSRNDEIDKGILKKENERSTVNHIVLHEETESTNKNNEQPSLMELKQNDDSTNAPKKKRMRIRHRNVKQSGDEYGASCDSRDDQYATWLPPEDQSGDGKTKLHEKFIGRY